MSDFKDFVAMIRNNMEPETIYIKEVEGTVIVFYKHYKENSIFIITRNNDEIRVFRNGENILSFNCLDVKNGVRTLNDMLNAYAVYITMNYKKDKTAEEIENESTRNTTKSSFEGLFWIDDGDMDIVLIRYTAKKE